MVGMLSDCISSNPSLSELLIVWSEEAKAKAKAERDRMTQAVLDMSMDFDPDADLSDIFDNDGLRAIIASTGVGVSLPAHLLESVGPESVTYEKLRYHKVIIALLPGEEGRILVRNHLNFIYHYQRPLIPNGHVYLALEAMDEDSSSDKIRDTLINPETRRIKQVVGYETWEETLAALSEASRK